MKVGSAVKLVSDLGEPGDLDYVPAGTVGEIRHIDDGEHMFPIMVQFSEDLIWVVNEQEIGEVE